MVNVTIIAPKYRMARCNGVRWKYNKHKRPFYLLSEINWAIRNNKKDTVLRVLFKKNYKAYYRFER